MFSESLDERPDVGSSRNNTEGSLINSREIFNLFRWPPLIVLSNGLPTFKSTVSPSPRLLSKSNTIVSIFSSGYPSKQSLAL